MVIIYTFGISIGLSDERLNSNTASNYTITPEVFMVLKQE